jgi:hypothetical protein
MFTPMLCDNHQAGLQSGFSAERAERIPNQGSDAAWQSAPTASGVRASLMAALQNIAGRTFDARRIRAAARDRFGCTIVTLCVFQLLRAFRLI